MANKKSIWVLRFKNWKKDRKFRQARNWCHCCWSTESKGGMWHGTSEAMRKLHPDWSWVCSDCYQKPPSPGFGITQRERLERNLKPGHVLGPDVNGMRGVYDMRRSRRR